MNVIAEPRAAAPVPDHFEDALKFVSARRMPYILMNRAVIVGAGTNGAEQFANDTYDALKTRFASTTECGDFFAWATAHPRPCKLTVILATIHALRNADIARARRWATQARHLLANDLFAQRLEALAFGDAAEGQQDTTGTFCRAPFESIETTPSGDVHFCCPAWQPVPIGNLNKNTPEEIWNSPTAQEIRRSIHDKTYRFCSRVHCALISSGSLPKPHQIKSKRLKEIVANKSVILPYRPRKLNLAHDRSCTLTCPSCRTGLIKASRSEQNEMNRMADEVLLPLCRDADCVRVTASGDPFGSGHFRYVLGRLERKLFPKLKIEIQTNGVLFDKRVWNRLDLANRLSLVAVSTDAARRATYELIRRGGNFEKLRTNLRFLGERRRAGQIEALRLDFVVQALNFREMPEVVEMAVDYGADRVKFQMIRNWNTYSTAAFAEQDIGSTAHRDYHAFLSVLRHPLLRSSMVEFWGMGRALEDAAGDRSMVRTAVM